VACVVLLAFAFIASRARGALIAYEPFDYPVGSALKGKTNGFGFAEPWRPGGFNARLSNLAHMEPGPLEYPGLTVNGSNHLHISAVEAAAGISGLARLLATNLNSPGAKFYLGFLHRPDGEKGYSAVVLGTGTGVELAITQSDKVPRYHIAQRGGNRPVLSDVESGVGKTALIVVKMEFRKGRDRFTLFVNPIPGQPEPPEGVVKEDLDLEFAENLTLYSRGAWSVDELRLGTTWEDVTPAHGGPPATEP
jgi:hypothetical protein